MSDTTCKKCAVRDQYITMLLDAATRYKNVYIKAQKKLRSRAGK
jgi:hypothetical protein